MISEIKERIENNAEGSLNISIETVNGKCIFRNIVSFNNINFAGNAINFYFGDGYTSVMDLSDLVERGYDLDEDEYVFEIDGVYLYITF